MGANLSVIPELEELVQHGSPEKRVGTLQRITALFLDGASRYNDAQVDLFDDVFGLHIDEIEIKARAELSNHLAPVSNAPVKVLRKLANDDDIAVAGPSQAGAAFGGMRPHRCRHDQGSSTTACDLRAPGAGRGGHRCARATMQSRRCPPRRDNRTARISEKSFHRLVERAEEDGILAEKVGLRPDIPPQWFRGLLTKATVVVHRRLIASAMPEVRATICDVLAKVSQEVGSRGGPRDYSAAQRVVLSLDRANQLNEAALTAFCAEGKYEETV